MAIQLIDLTTVQPDGRVGDPGRTAFTKVNANFAELYTSAPFATRLKTGRAIALAGDVTGSATFDGSAGISITATVAGPIKGLNSGPTSQDPNDATTQVIVSNHANTPKAATYWHITTTFYSTISATANRSQIAVQYLGGSQVWARSCYGSEWTEWTRCDNAGIVVPTVPTTNIGPTILVTGWGWMEWVSTTYFTGYRSPLCGRPVDGHTLAGPLAHEVDATGGLLSKTTYAGLWGYARENGLVVTQTVWAANVGAHMFVDVNATQFRVSDLRSVFRRYTGFDADTGLARGLGTKQGDAYRSHGHSFWRAPTSFSEMSPGGAVLAEQTTTAGFRILDGAEASGGTETRPLNTAFYPRIHA